MIKNHLMLPLLVAAFSTLASGQDIAPTSPSLASETVAGSSGPRSSLFAEASIPDVEPLSKRFRMNIPFVKAARECRGTPIHLGHL